MTTSLPRPVRLGLLPLGVAFGLLAERTRLLANWPVTWAAADLVPGIAFLIAGTVAWERRPDNRIGPLMVATGFAWYVGTYAASFNPVIDAAAYGFSGYYDALLAWLVLAYPSGRLRRPAFRVVVAAFFGLLAVRSAFRIALFRPSTALDVSDPAALDRYIADLSLRDAGDTLDAQLLADAAVREIFFDRVNRYAAVEQRDKRAGDVRRLRLAPRAEREAARILLDDGVADGASLQQQREICTGTAQHLREPQHGVVLLFERGAVGRIHDV